MDNNFEAGYTHDVLTKYEIITVPYNILYGFLCSLGILANLLIITVVLKYNYMKTPTNLYILQWAVFNILYLVHFIYFYVIKKFFTLYDLYVSYELEAILELAIIIILLLLTFDRCVEDEITSQRLPIFVWFFLTMCLIVSHRWHMLHVFQLGCSGAYIATIIAVLIKQIIYIVKRNKEAFSANRKIRLIIVSIYVYSWGLAWGSYCLAKKTVDLERALDILISALISTGLGLIGSLVNVILLCNMDVHFKTSLLNVLTCSSSSTIDINVQDFEDNDKDNTAEARHRAVFII